MSLKPFSKIRTGNDFVDRIQDNISSTFDPITNNQALDNNFLTSIVLTAGKDNSVAHGLGRPLQGWKLIRIRGESIVWDKQDTNTLANRTLILWCSADVTVDLEVF